MKKHLLCSTLVLLMSALNTPVHATVTVTWASDATANIQAAIDTGDPDIIIPNTGQDWVVRPLFLNRGSQQITFAPGVVVKAKAGGFPNNGDCMFSAVGKNYITLTGYGATLQMLKSEYTTGEWRHTLSFKTCSNINILGLTVLDSGGDGVFIADSYVSPYCCTDVLIKDCVFSNHRRLGAAVISGKNVTFENCVFRNSNGTAPQAGVDLEPDQPFQRLDNIDFYNCFATANSGSGYLLATNWMNSTSAPVDVELHRCYAQDQINGTYELYLLPETEATGIFKATDCTFVNDAKACLYANRNWNNTIAFSATRCRFESKLQAPLRIVDSTTPQCGDFTFTDCVAHYQGATPYIVWEIYDGINSGITDVAGNIDVYNPNGATVNWGSNFSNITLVSTPHNTKVPEVAITSPAMGATFATGATINFTATAYDPDAGTADGNGMSQTVFEVWRCDNATNALKASVVDNSAAYSTTFDTSGWTQGIYMLVARGKSADGSEKRRLTYVRLTGGSSGGGSGGETAFVTSQTLGTYRNNYTGALGFKFTPNSNLTITKLARWVVSGNTGTHTVKLVYASTGGDVPGGSVSIATSGAPAGFKYAALATPVTLSAGTTYYLVSTETSGQDFWYSFDTVIAHTNHAVVNSGIYSNTANGPWGINGSTNNSYIPLSFMIQGGTPAETAFVTGQTLGTYRNNYTGALGFRFTPSSSLKVTKLARWVVSGNTGTHTVKLVYASTGGDVPGGSVSVATAGAPVGFKYVTLASPVNLFAGTPYYIVSTETSGQDAWYGVDTIITHTSQAAVHSGIYSNTANGPWSTNGSTNNSYIPLSFMTSL